MLQGSVSYLNVAPVFCKLVEGRSGKLESLQIISLHQFVENCNQECFCYTAVSEHPQIFV